MTSPFRPHTALVNHARLLLLTQYSSRLSPRSFNFLWPPPRLLLHIQQFLPADLLGLLEQGGESLEKSYGSSEVDYQKSFLKDLIAKLDHAVQWAVEHGAQDDEWEVDDGLVSYYANLMAIPSVSSSTALRPSGGDAMESLSASLPYTNHSTPSERHLSYYYPSPRKRQGEDESESLTSTWSQVHLHESSALVGAGTTALKTWEASLRLASHLLCDKTDIVSTGARVLELGSGTGFLSVVVAALQSEAGNSAKLCSTDLPSIVKGKLRRTFELNGVLPTTTAGQDVQLLDIDWIDVEQQVNHDKRVARSVEDSSAAEAISNFAPTLILGADIIFDPSIINPLVSTIKVALQAGEASTIGARRPQALIASTVRNVATYSKFLASLDQAELISQEVELEKYVVNAPICEGFDEHVPPIIVFSSGHDELREGIVKGLRITLPIAENT